MELKIGKQFNPNFLMNENTVMLRFYEYYYLLHEGGKQVQGCIIFRITPPPQGEGGDF